MTNTAAGRRTETDAPQAYRARLLVRRLAPSSGVNRIASKASDATERFAMVLNRQRQVRIPIQTLEEFLARARRALRLPRESFTLCLVTNATIARWNRSYRGKNRPTDVLSFPTNESKRSGRIPRSFRMREEGNGAYLGDIAIAPRVAQRNARELGRTLDEELCVLALHGVLHLMGYDHETDSGQMERRERRLRRALRLT